MALKVSKKLQKEYKYIPVIERESENPTTFIIRVLSKKEKAELEDNLVSIDQVNQSMKIANSSFIIGAVKKGLVRVENLLDEDGKSIEVKRDSNGEISDEFLDLLPDEIINELGNVIIAISKDPNNAELYLGETKENKVEEK